jgi:hypothetical protein
MKCKHCKKKIVGVCIVSECDQFVDVDSKGVPDPDSYTEPEVGITIRVLCSSVEEDFIEDSGCLGDVTSQFPKL